MSIQDGKVHLYLTKHRNRIAIGALLCVQAVLTLVLSVSLAARLIWPESTNAALGVPMQIAYEGRLTDSSGNALGGTGSPYCVRFSIYDAPSGGNKLWPGSTPTNTVATSTDGVFTSVIGQADTLSSSVFDFSTTSTAYLQVDVYNVSSATCTGGSFESMTPRQQILSSGYAMSATNMPLLKNDITNSLVRIGTTNGGGTATPVYLALDVKNTADYVGQTCTVNGQMWYNFTTSQGLICEGGIINRLGNTGTTTIAAINAGGTAASAGTVNFGNANNVSFGINGNTITASASFAGGGMTFQSYEPYPAVSASALLSSNNNTSGAASFLQFNIGNYVEADFMNLAASVSFVTLGTSNGSQSYTLNYGLYTRGAGASSSILSQVTSSSFSLAMSWNNSTFTVSQPTSTNSAGFTYGTTSSAGSSLTSAYTGVKAFQLPVNSVLAPGNYWLGLMNRNSSSSVSGGLKISVAGIAQLQNGAPLGSFSSGFTSGTNATRNIGGNWYLGNGSYTSAGQTNLPSTVALSAISASITVRPYMRFFAST